MQSDRHFGRLIPPQCNLLKIKFLLNGKIRVPCSGLPHFSPSMVNYRQPQRFLFAVPHTKADRPLVLPKTKTPQIFNDRRPFSRTHTRPSINSTQWLDESLATTSDWWKVIGLVRDALTSWGCGKANIFDLDHAETLTKIFINSCTQPWQSLGYESLRTLPSSFNKCYQCPRNRYATG